MIHFIVALKTEAEFLIKAYHLKRLSTDIKSVYPVFNNENRSISLTLSGIGKLNAGCAVTETHHLFASSKHDIWLNIGVAGHGEYAVGDLIIANKIIDALSNKQYYPSFIFKHGINTSEFHCFDFPSNDYSNAAMDMESCGFYEMASRIGTTEFIHSLKVVSDNSEESLAGINANIVKTLMHNKLPEITTFVETLKQYQAKIIQDDFFDCELYQDILQKYHFTSSQQQQLKKLISQIMNLSPSFDMKQTVNNKRNAKEVLNILANTHRDTKVKL